MSVGLGPTIGNHEIQKKLGFSHFRKFQKTRKKLYFHIFLKCLKTTKSPKKLEFEKSWNKPFLAQKHALRRQKRSGRKFCQSPVSHSRHDTNERNRATPESAPVNQSINLWSHRFILILQPQAPWIIIIFPPTHWNKTLRANSTRFATTSNLISH